MLKILLKKQLLDINRSFFQNGKTGKARSRIASIFMIIGFALLMVVFLGGGFTALEVSMGIPLMAAGMDWLYFLLIGGIAAALGLFGSVFSTYSGLYMAKDNDLLLSMPIPINAILAMRLMGVYLMDLMFIAIVMVPAIVIYAILGATWINVLCAAAFMLVISLLVLCMSCALGWVVAKVGSKIKKKSIATTLLSLLGVALYYFIIGKAKQPIADIIENGVLIGAQVKSSSNLLYRLGRAAAGDGLALLIFAAIVIALLALVWWIIRRSFIRLATMQVGSTSEKLRDVAMDARGIDAALLSRERRRFTSSATYMLNCGLGTVFMIAGGIAALIKGRDLMQTFAMIPDGVLDSGVFALIAAAAMCMLTSLNDITAPSISLEGKSLWVIKSLPVSAWSVLRAKLRLHILLTCIPGAFCALCMACVLKADAYLAVLLVLISVLFGAFGAAFGLFIGLKKPNFNWTNETAAVKQSISVLIALLSGWICVALFAAAYFLLPVKPEPRVFLLIVVIAMALLTGGLLLWIKKRGTKVFAAL